MRHVLYLGHTFYHLRPLGHASLRPLAETVRFRSGHDRVNLAGNADGIVALVEEFPYLEETWQFIQRADGLVVIDPAQPAEARRHDRPVRRLLRMLEVGPPAESRDSDE